ncbi:MAG: hypothetical protein ACJAWV_001767 [Flammeovirgaceae bacterium]|jgi:hypothetical protein
MKEISFPQEENNTANFEFKLLASASRVVSASDRQK